jgi:hypothetical protein
MQKEACLAKSGYGDGANQPDTGTTQNITPTLLPLQEGKTLKIEHHQSERARGRGFSDREFCHDWGRRREREMERAEPRDDRQGQKQKALIEPSLWIGLEDSDSEYQLKRYGPNCWNCGATHLGSDAI